MPKSAKQETLERISKIKSPVARRVVEKIADGVYSGRLSGDDLELLAAVAEQVAMLERGIKSQSNAGRVWYGYAPYNPAQVQELLDIFRTVHKYVLVSNKDKKTPAMRFGTARGHVSLKDIIYFK